MHLTCIDISKYTYGIIHISTCPQKSYNPRSPPYILGPIKTGSNLPTNTSLQCLQCPNSKYIFFLIFFEFSSNFWVKVRPLQGTWVYPHQTHKLMTLWSWLFKQGHDHCANCYHKVGRAQLS